MSRRVAEYAVMMNQTAQSLYFWNRSIIYMNKIRVGTLTSQPSKSENPFEHLNKVFYCFQHNLDNKKINVYFCNRNLQNMTLVADWDKYILIAFHIIQNAVKYNSLMGSIVIILRVFIHEGINYLETEIIDTGLGISKERQELLFKPFGELSRTQTMKEVKDMSIGMGLSFSRAIASELGGIIEINVINETLTSLIFRIPVEVKQETKT